MEAWTGNVMTHMLIRFISNLTMHIDILHVVACNAF